MQVGRIDRFVTTVAGSVASPALPPRPGKIIGVHINYRARAAERGRTPAFPGYFLKPATSVSQSGTPIERPAGTELLAFEGEIAIILGTTARRIDIAEAWSAVSGVTASNDFGVYDLRLADKGSNVRSKGGDGFTPLGPSVIPAAAIDPTALRIRTWVNGELVQEDTTAGLLFPFAQLVADLSQQLTLEPGDVILTGTPAGASVVQPGDIVEVEVDAPGSPGHLSSGRLVTPIAQGSIPVPGFSAPPEVNDEQRADAWGSAEAAGLGAQQRGARRRGNTPAARSKTQQTYASIKARISAGTYPPGFRLVLAGLAGELGVSVVPVREAIRMLESEGLVTFEHNVGAQVAMHDDTEYVHTMQALSLVEGAATAMSAPHLGPGDIAAARAINQRMIESLDHFDPHQFTELNQQFHSALFENCPNEHLLHLVHREWARLAVLRDSTFSFVPDRATASVVEHEELLRLIESGAPPSDIEIAARSHRTRTLDAFLAANDGERS